MTVATTVTTEKFIRWRYLWWALSAVGVMIAAILAGNIWFLDFVHVFSSRLWTRALISLWDLCSVQSCAGLTFQFAEKSCGG